MKEELRREDERKIKGKAGKEAIGAKLLPPAAVPQ